MDEDMQKEIQAAGRNLRDCVEAVNLAIQRASDLGIQIVIVQSRSRGKSTRLSVRIDRQL